MPKPQLRSPTPGRPIIADYDGNNSVTVRLDATASTDIDNDIVSYSWSWPGGTPTTGQIAEGTFPATNTPVTVTLTVTDCSVQRLYGHTCRHRLSDASGVVPRTGGVSHSSFRNRCDHRREHGSPVRRQPPARCLPQKQRRVEPDTRHPHRLQPFRRGSKYNLRWKLQFRNQPRRPPVQWQPVGRLRAHVIRSLDAAGIPTECLTTSRRIPKR